MARRVVIFQFDTSDPGWFWLAGDYLPEFPLLAARQPALAHRAAAIGARTEPVPVPWDCADGFFSAYWRRPEAYLRGEVRRGTSVWDRPGPQVERRAVRRLRDDLRSGRWPARNQELLELAAADLGARLLIA